MNALTFTLRHAPEQRLDLSLLTPATLAALSQREIERLSIGTTRLPVVVGDMFRLRGSEAGRIRFAGGHERLDMVGHGLAAGEIVVEGDVGQQAGRLMAGGRLVVAGNAGPLLGSGLKAGRIEVKGHAGDRAGGPLAGEMAGMRGGSIQVRGNAGDRAGDRMRRGLLVIEGDAGDYAGSRMIAGTVIIGGQAGAYPGYLMRRGTIILGREPLQLSPSFVDTGEAAPVFLRLLWRSLEQDGFAVAGLEGSTRRLAGDTAMLGRGEMLLPRKAHTVHDTKDVSSAPMAPPQGIGPKPRKKG
ncbi:formylmethanofuran dehydrogenase subunit C [Rhodoligotrophos appendicifer]|uniref:formylmethanofuran dehydrogenase subunit C n=1 Tax=Rhodoligotrophos appendicifer TaxID=987056 RepID=UPI0011848D16|nr:formylmethanofuran dehydrogenase subunit C [Rhodoligotrophos appendicifer]